MVTNDFKMTGEKRSIARVNDHTAGFLNQNHVKPIIC